VNRPYYLYCRVAAIVFAIITIYVLTANTVRQHLAHDWFHSVLPVTSAVLGAYAALKVTDVIPAKVFTWSIGVLYLGLGTYGWFTPGLFMNSPLAIPLSAGDNIVHLLRSGPALAIVGRDLLTSSQSLATIPRR
jgi:hypothetical protein